MCVLNFGFQIVNWAILRELSEIMLSFDNLNHKWREFLNDYHIFLK